jgi:hypothetical protein
MKPAAIRSRERRFNLWLKREEDQFNSEVKRHMDMGLSFDDAWRAAGGLVIPVAAQPSGVTK